MAEVPKEPGHRYVPRQARSRYMDMRSRGRIPLNAPSHSHGTNVAQPHEATSKPIAEPDPEPKTEVVKPQADQNSLKSKPDVASATRTSATPAHTAPRQQAAVQRQSGHAKTKPALPRLNRSMVLRRQIVDRAAQHQKQSYDQRKRTLLAFGLGGLLATFITGGAFVIYTAQHKPQVLADQSSIRSIAKSQNALSASERPVAPAEIDAYTTAADRPRLLKIPKLNLQSRIYPVQADLSGEPLTTSDIYDVGWLSTSVVPGGNGAALINGYTSGASKNGAFAGLDSLAVGDEIHVIRGDGTDLVFKVVRSQQYDSDKVNMAAATQPAIAGTPGLNLLTNTGRYDARTDQFEQRIVIFAALKE